MRIALVTDAWHPQRNGVVRVLSTLTDRLKALGHTLQVFSPDQHRTIPCPSYPEILLSLFPGQKLTAQLNDYAPQAVHLATEGPLGIAGRAWCLKNRFPFTTAFHTRFPHYIKARLGIPLSWSYTAIRRFHAPSSAVMCPSPSVYRDLTQWKFHNAALWCHGVDTEIFRPQAKSFLDLPRPIFAYVGRVAVEKNLPAFLSLDLPGSKLVVGDGPAREGLMKQYPDAHWRIANGDQELSRYFAALDGFVFPSLTDTFGLVMLEALASGVPVAAFPVPGPMDVLDGSSVGIMDPDLKAAALQSLSIDPVLCRAHAQKFSWDLVAEQFLSLLHVRQ